MLNCVVEQSIEMYCVNACNCPHRRWKELCMHYRVPPPCPCFILDTLSAPIQLPTLSCIAPRLRVCSPQFELWYSYPYPCQKEFCKLPAVPISSTNMFYKLSGSWAWVWMSQSTLHHKHNIGCSFAFHSRIHLTSFAFRSHINSPKYMFC